MQKIKISILLLFVLGVAAIWFVINNGQSTINNALRSFSVNDTASINKIVLADKTHTVTLERNEDGLWEVNKIHDANPKAMQTLLYTINKLDIKSPIGKNEAKAVVKKLVESAIRCDIYQHGELKKSYYVGSSTSDKMGTYMVLIDIDLNEPVEKPFITYVPGYNSSINHHYKIDAREWADKTVFNYNETDIQSILVENPLSSDKTYELLVNNGDYKLKMHSPNRLLTNIDTASVKQYLTYYFKLNYESVDTTHKDFSQQQPISIITITDKNGIKSKVAFYKNTTSETIANAAYLKAKLNNGDVVNVQLYLFGKLFQEPGYFLKKEHFSTK